MPPNLKFGTHPPLFPLTHHPQKAPRSDIELRAPYFSTFSRPPPFSPLASPPSSFSPLSHRPQPASPYCSSFLLIFNLIEDLSPPHRRLSPLPSAWCIPFWPALYLCNGTIDSSASTTRTVSRIPRFELYTRHIANCHTHSLSLSYTRHPPSHESLSSPHFENRNQLISGKDKPSSFLASA